MLVIGARGRLQSMSLPVLLRWISGDRKTGALVLDQGSISKKIFFREGVIVSSSSNDPKEYLGQFLLRHRLINEDQLREAMETQRQCRMMLGKLLLEAKVIDEADLQRLLAKKAEETIYSLFIWEQGEFQFLEGEIMRKTEVPITLTVDDVLLEGNRRYENLRKIRKTFASDQAVLTKTGRRPPEKFLKQPMVQQIFGLLDGARTIADICLQLHAPEFSVSWILLQMFDKGYVAFPPDITKKFPTREQAHSALVEQAMGLLGKEDYEPALYLLEQIRTENPQDRNIPKLVDRAETGYLEWVYRESLPPKGTLVLDRSLKSLMAEDLTSEEGFIVSRLTGKIDVESLVSISPIREVDVLRTLRRLLERGYISLQNGSNGDRSPKSQPPAARPVFDRKGWGVGWILNNVLFDNGGMAQAFIKNDGVFRFDGGYLGQVEDGFFRDRSGDVVGWLKGATGGPLLPTTLSSGEPPSIARVPTIPLDDLVAAKPASPSLSWSKLDFTQYLTS
jgi:hypothetical protein